jgi:hypothetical protein
MLHRPLFNDIASCVALLAALVLATGCSLDKHQSLYNQMLDCEQRYANLLAKASDSASVKEFRPQMSAEAKKYRDLGEQFLTAEGLTPEKMKDILRRTADRRQKISAQIKEHLLRLTANGTDNEMRLAIPSLEWSAVTLDFAFDADAVASGKKRHKEQMKDEMQAAKERMQKSQEAMKARVEASRARFEEMRSKMRRPDSAPAGQP